MLLDERARDAVGDGGRVARRLPHAAVGRRPRADDAALLLPSKKLGALVHTLVEIVIDIRPVLLLLTIIGGLAIALYILLQHCTTRSGRI